MNLVDITQDGAGVASKHDSSVDGFLTGLVETCSVYVFYGAKRYAIVHDTGQLTIAGICEVARKCGPILDAFYAVNPLRLSNEASESHQDRRIRLKNLLKPKRGIKKLEIPDGTFVCLKDGNVLLADDEILALDAAMAQSPKREARKAINILNNLFSSKNSQSLPVDFQFNVDHYTSLPKFQKTDAQMQAIAVAKLQQGDADYLSILETARSRIRNGADGTLENAD
ncbi:hypothetical protein AWV79_20305 [Cupriavidus sp. UYMMa02A]|nr:hypothetical protein AWV79_20305 [Cupriavidus sp. UYMMa02A]